MSKQNDEEVEIVPQNINPFVLPIDKTKPPVSYADIAAAMGLSGPRIPAENLIDEHFIIMGGKAFQSSFQEDKHAYFCVCKNAQTGEIFTTTLGGDACVEILDALAAAGFSSPLDVTLRQVAGGRFGRYYTFE